MSQADYWLKIKGIESESVDKSNPGEFQLQSWSFGASQSGSAKTGTGLGRGKVSVSDFNFVIEHSKMSAKLFQHLCKGVHVDECILTCRQVTGDGVTKPYMIVKFSDVIISSYHVGGSDGSDSKPMESISFNFVKMFYETKVQDNKGVIKNGSEATFDAKVNETT